MVTIHADKPPFMTATDLALALRVKYSVVRQAIAACILTPPRAGRLAIFPTGDLESIREKLIDAGLIAAPEAVAAGK